jgi:hypothetical protein
MAKVNPLFWTIQLCIPFMGLVYFWNISHIFLISGAGKADKKVGTPIKISCQQ